jgi:hypothetical protein
MAWRLSHYREAESMRRPSSNAVFFGLVVGLGLFLDMVPAISNGLLTLTYPQSASATDVSLDVQWSPDVKSWYAGTPYVRPVSVPYHATNRVVTVPTGAVGATNPAGFFRFQASRL